MCTVHDVWGRSRDRATGHPSSRGSTRPWRINYADRTANSHGPVACDLLARLTQHCTYRLPCIPSPYRHSYLAASCGEQPPTAAMDDLREQIELLESSANLSASIDHVQKAINMLTAAREKIAAGRFAYRVTQTCS